MSRKRCPNPPMSDADVVKLLTDISRRLATLADQAHETREQATHTLDRIYLLREDVMQLRKRLMGEDEEQKASA